MNANADVNLLVLLLLGVVSTELRLDVLGALHSVNHGGEVHQKGIADSLDDRAVMLRYSLLDDLIMHIQQTQHAGFVRAHLAAKARYVSEHDGGQLAGLGGCRRWRVSAHGAIMRRTSPNCQIAYDARRTEQAAEKDFAYLDPL